MYIQTDEQGRVCAYADEDILVDGIEVSTVPDGFGADTMQDYRIESGALVLDADAVEAREKAAQVEKAVGSLPADQTDQNDAICELYEMVIALMGGE
jgi:hypothetical protein